MLSLVVVSVTWWQPSRLASARTASMSMVPMPWYRSRALIVAISRTSWRTSNVTRPAMRPLRSAMKPGSAAGWKTPSCTTTSGAPHNCVVSHSTVGRSFSSTGRIATSRGYTTTIIRISSGSGPVPRGFSTECLRAVPCEPLEPPDRGPDVSFVEGVRHHAEHDDREQGRDGADACLQDGAADGHDQRDREARGGRGGRGGDPGEGGVPEPGDRRRAAQPPGRDHHRDGHRDLPDTAGQRERANGQPRRREQDHREGEHRGQQLLCHQADARDLELAEGEQHPR